MYFTIATIKYYLYLSDWKKLHKIQKPLIPQYFTWDQKSMKTKL